MSDLGALQVDRGSPQAPVTPPAPRHRVRRVITWVLVVIFGILTPLTLVSAWAVRTLTNTDRYVATLQPLATDPVVTNFVADQATTQIFSHFNIQQRIESALPIKASFIAAPLTSEIRGFTQTQLRKVTSSPYFAELWQKENHYTQEAAVAVLTGKAKPEIDKAQALAVSVTPVINKGIDALNAKGITVFNPLKERLAKDQQLAINLVSNDQVSKAQTFFNLAINLRWALLIGTPLIGLIAIAVAVERRRAALRVALAGVIGSLAAIVLLTVGRQEFINAVSPSYQEVATHVFDIIFRFLQGTIRWTLLVFVILAVVFWLIGTSKWAVALRRSVGSGAKKVGSTASEAAHSEAAAKALDQLQRAAAYVARTQPPFRWGGVIVAGIFILTNRTISAMVWTLILLGIYQLVISLIAWWSSKAAGSDQGEPHESNEEDGAHPVTS